MYGPHNTLHVDDLARNFALNPANGMKIKAYREDMCAPPLITEPAAPATASDMRCRYDSDCELQLLTRYLLDNRSLLTLVPLCRSLSSL